jgi:tetratricopeptide (TPR) repeat protein
MNKFIHEFVAFAGLSLFLCACSSHSSNATVHGLTPGEASQMNSQNARISEEKTPAVTANTRFAAGQLAEVQGDLGKAIHQYNKALEIDSNHLPSLFRLGVIYAGQKDYAKSIEVWKRYIAASGDQGFGYGNLGYCYELAGMPNTAVSTYQKGIAKDPKNASCRTNYGIFLAREGHTQEAILMWNPVLSDAEIHYNLASVYQISGRKAEARSEYLKALAADPTLIDARARLSQLPND